MTARHELIAKVLLATVGLVFAGGLTYQEGKALLHVAAELMDQVDRTPNMSDDALAEMAASMIEAYLDQGKVHG